MQFSKIIGQDEIKKRLISTVNENRISHAQLFFGPEGNGKLALAIAYAQYVSCQNKQPDDSCGTCPSCLKYEKLVHPDLHFVYPIIKKDKLKVSIDYISQWRDFINQNPYINVNQWFENCGAENKQGMIYTDESKEILKTLNLKTYEAEYKIMIIWLPEKMHTSCSNKLLKILEEPPPKTLFIMVSQFPDELIQTVRSRTQLVKVPKISDADLKETIQAESDLDINSINDIVRLSNGSYISAKDNLEHNDAHEANYNMFIKMMRLCYGGKVLEMFKWVEDISAIGREKQKMYLLYSIRMIRDNLMFNTDNHHLARQTVTEAEFSKRFSQFINPNNAPKIAKQLNDSYYYIERNGYNKLVFSDLVLNVAMLLKR